MFWAFGTFEREPFAASGPSSVTVAAGCAPSHRSATMDGATPAIARQTPSPPVTLTTTARAAHRRKGPRYSKSDQDETQGRERALTGHGRASRPLAQGA